MDLLFKGLTAEQAKTLAEWFCGQGEQDCAIWFESAGIPSPYVHSQRKGGGIVEGKDQVTVYCYTPE